MNQTGLTLAKTGYEAYAAQTGGTTFDGRDMPKWNDLPLRTVEAWFSAAVAIEHAVENNPKTGDGAAE